MFIHFIQNLIFSHGHSDSEIIDDYLKSKLIIQIYTPTRAYVSLA